MQNAAKYSGAASLDVTLAEHRDGLRFEIGDDGRGFDQATTPRGSGLQNIVDRLDALGGSVEVTSSPGAGTRLVGWIPTGPTRAGPAPGAVVEDREER